MTTEIENPLNWTLIHRIIQDQERYNNTPEFIEFFGGYNDPLPNMKEIEAEEFWRFFSMYGTGIYQGYRQIIEKGPPRKAAIPVHYFIYTGGTGFAIHVSYNYKYINSPKWNPIFYKFAICEHERVSTLDTIRGWHEGHCRKCGLGMNYDSGD